MTLENDPRYKLYIGNHKEETRKYSSIWANSLIGTGYARSMINSPQAWSAKYNRKNQWVEIDMGHEKQIGGVVIQPRKEMPSYFDWRYYVSTYPDLRHFKTYGTALAHWKRYGKKEGRRINSKHLQYVKYVDVFTKKDGESNWSKQLSNAKANTQPNQTTKIYFNNISICRYVRISVLDWNSHISMRTDVLIADYSGIMESMHKLYIGNHKEETRKYSSIHRNNQIGTGYARSMIDSLQAWSAKYNRKNQWMEIDMGHEKQIGGVVIQTRNSLYNGRRDGGSELQYVKYVDVFTKKDGESDWSKQLSNAKANTQPNQTTKIYFGSRVMCRYVRISVLDWNRHISMRSDVLNADYSDIFENITKYNSLRGHARVSINNYMDIIKNNDDFEKGNEIDKIYKIIYELIEQYNYLHTISKEINLDNHLKKKVLNNMESHMIVINETYNNLYSFINNGNQKISLLNMNKLNDISLKEKEIVKTTNNIKTQLQNNYVNKNRVNMITNNNYRKLYSLIIFIIIAFVFLVILLLKYKHKL